MAKFYLDAGHGGPDSGAVGVDGRFEKTDNLKLMLKVKALLEAQGHSCVCARTEDTYVDLHTRPEQANAANCDYYIALHRNSAGEDANGIEAWVVHNALDKTVAQARGILDEIIAVTGFKNRGVKKGYTGNPNADYAVNRISRMPSVLIEIGFVSNTTDNKTFDNRLTDIAVAVVKGLCKAVESSYIQTAPQPVPEPEKPANKVITVNSGTWNVRSAPNMSAGVVRIAKGGQQYICYSINADGWAHIDGGYIGPKGYKVK